MASNTTLTIDSVKYTFTKSGACQNPPSSLSGMSDSYFDPSASQGTGTSSGSSSPSSTSGPSGTASNNSNSGTSSSGNTNNSNSSDHSTSFTAPEVQQLQLVKWFFVRRFGYSGSLPGRAGLPVRQALRITRQAAVPPAIPAMYQAASTATARLTPHRRHQAPAHQALRQIRPINGLTDLPPIRAIRFRRDRRRVLDGNKPYLPKYISVVKKILTNDS